MVGDLRKILLRRSFGYLAIRTCCEEREVGDLVPFLLRHMTLLQERLREYVMNLNLVVVPKDVRAESGPAEPVLGCPFSCYCIGHREQRVTPSCIVQFIGSHLQIAQRT